MKGRFSRQYRGSGSRVCSKFEEYGGIVAKFVVEQEVAQRVERERCIVAVEIVFGEGGG